MSEPVILVERKPYGNRGHVAWITVNKVRRANCLDHETLLAFADAVNEESKSPDLRAMVITGAGERAFMAGADLNVIAGQDADGAKLFLTRVHRMCQSVRECPVPVIARINGACFGAALELVAAEAIDAAKALQWGLLEAVTDSHAALDAEVERVVGMIVHAAPNAMRLQKDLVRAWEGMGVDAAILEGIRVAERTYRLSNEPNAYAAKVLASLKK